MSTAPKPWPRRGGERGPDFGIFQVRLDDLENPRTGRTLRRVVLENPDWVNVVARTPEQRIVVIRQYRFGIGAVTLEIPGGMIDPGEDSLQAARRELAEETGYTATDWHYLGCVEPNPAFQDNLCHHWLAEGAVLTGAPALDAGEDIEVSTLDQDSLRAAVSAGHMRHVLVVSALACAIGLAGASLDELPGWARRARSGPPDAPEGA